MKKPVVAIDGPSGSGKSTAAKMLAKRLNVPHIDTGAMYRSVTLAALNEGVAFEKNRTIAQLAKKLRIEFKQTPKGQNQVFLNGANVTREIRSPKLTAFVHHVASNVGVRRVMVDLQRKMSQIAGGVMEGRDIGTVVLRDAPFKFYLDSDVKIRAKRRFRELQEVGVRVNLKQILEDQIARDNSDYNRKVGALKVAKDALLIDSTHLTTRQTVDKMQRYILNQIKSTT